mmetsp:Transcript_47864/g.104155  ORF Transcript_47864/g.104155 Transcript_47864/m.104155 type:complete len:226 (+) Transcript_47864:724-1401(+)
MHNPMLLHQRLHLLLPPLVPGHHHVLRPQLLQLLGLLLPPHHVDERHALQLAQLHEHLPELGRGGGVHEPGAAVLPHCVDDPGGGEGVHEEGARVGQLDLVGDLVGALHSGNAHVLLVAAADFHAGDTHLLADQPVGHHASSALHHNTASLLPEVRHLPLLAPLHVVTGVHGRRHHLHQHLPALGLRDRALLHHKLHLVRVLVGLHHQLLHGGGHRLDTGRSTHD